MDEQMRLPFVIMTDLSKLRHFSAAIFSETRSVTPIFFFFFFLGGGGKYFMT